MQKLMAIAIRGKNAAHLEQLWQGGTLYTRQALAAAHL